MVLGFVEICADWFVRSLSAASAWIWCAIVYLWLSSAPFAVAAEVSHTITPKKPAPGRSVLVLVHQPAAQKATLFYRVQGMSVFQKVAGELASEDVRFAIPGTSISSPGLEWYVELTRAGEVTRYPADTGFLNLEVSEGTPVKEQTFLPGDKVRSQRPRISFELEDSAVDQNSRFLLLVDGVDMGGAIERNGSTLSFRPDVPLSPGPHDVMFAVIDSYGNRSELQSWKLVVDATDVFDMKGNVSGSYQVSGARAKDINTALANSMDLEQIVSLSGFRTSIKGSFHGDLGQEKQSYDVSNFLISSKRGENEFQAGDVNVLLSPLTAPGISRRGLNFIVNQVGLRFNGFGVRSSDVHGFQNGFGIQDPDQLFWGGSVGKKIDGEKAEVRVNLLGGSNAESSGYNIASLRGAQRGTTVSGEVNYQPLPGKLRISSEYAHSDLNRNPDVSEAEDDQAFRVRGDLTMAGVAFSSGYQIYGGEFGSIANPSGNRNRWSWDTAGTRRFLNLFNAAVTFSQQQDNVAGDSRYPTMRNLQGGATLAFVRQKWPALSVNFQRGVQDGLELPVNFPAIRSRNDNWTISASYSRTLWSTNFMTSLGTFDNFGAFASSNSTRSHTATGTIRLGKRSSLSPAFSWVHSGGDFGGSTSKLLSVNHNAMLMKELVNASGAFSVMQNESAFQQGGITHSQQTSAYNATMQFSVNTSRWIKRYGRPTWSTRLGYSRFSQPAFTTSASRNSDFTVATSLDFSFPVRMF